MRTKILVTIPQKLEDERIGERVEALAKKKDRSMNWIALQAIREYLEREEGKDGGQS